VPVGGAPPEVVAYRTDLLASAVLSTLPRPTSDFVSDSSSLAAAASAAAMNDRPNVVRVASAAVAAPESWRLPPGLRLRAIRAGAFIPTADYL
jgi:hypothetical protein